MLYKEFVIKNKKTKTFLEIDDENKSKVYDMKEFNIESTYSHKDYDEVELELLEYIDNFKYNATDFAIVPMPIPHVVTVQIKNTKAPIQVEAENYWQASKFAGKSHEVNPDAIIHIEPKRFH